MKKRDKVELGKSFFFLKEGKIKQMRGKCRSKEAASQTVWKTPATTQTKSSEIEEGKRKSMERGARG